MDGIPDDILDSYEAYGCRVNAIEVDELFDRYATAGFLYPAKLARLKPFLPIIKKNWETVRCAGEDLMWTSVFSDASSWGTVTSWRSSGQGWLSQHLVSTGEVGGSAAVQLSGQAVKIRRAEVAAEQNWFRPTNRFPMKVFGSMAQKLGPDVASCAVHTLLSIDAGSISKDESGKIVVEATDDADAVAGVAEKTRGSVFVQAEELKQDLRLEAVDALYQSVGLSRTRTPILARRRSDGRPLGVALAYRGPLGLNFSFLENRCDVLVAPDLDDAARRAVALALLREAAPVYASFEPGAFPAVTDARTAALLAQAGGVEVVREYAQSIWLRDGFIGWYRHVEGFYDRIRKAGRRRGLAGRKAVEPADLAATAP